MTIIKNIHLLDGIIQDDAKEALNQSATVLRSSGITLKIIEVGERTLTVRVKQEKHSDDEYMDKKALVGIARQLFSIVLTDWKIHPQAIPYTPNPVSEIDSPWIKKQMEKSGIRVMDIVQDTGVDKTNISAWANATRPMSQPVKAMFYYYFKFKSVEQ